MDESSGSGRRRSAAAEAILALQAKVRGLEAERNELLRRVDALENESSMLRDALSRFVVVSSSAADFDDSCEGIARTQGHSPLRRVSQRSSPPPQQQRSLPWVAASGFAPSSSHSLVAHLQRLSRALHETPLQQRSRSMAAPAPSTPPAVCSRLGVHGAEAVDEALADYTDEEVRSALDEAETEYRLLRARFNADAAAERPDAAEMSALETHRRALQLLRRCWARRVLASAAETTTRSPTALLRESRTVADRLERRSGR